MLYKLGAVSYLNALPLIHYLKEQPTLAPPAALVRLLKLGEVDIATAPVAAWFENPEWSLLPGACIASNGPVGSVKVFFNEPGQDLTNVRSIYLDMESRTSALLLKVLLKFKYGRNLDEIKFYTPLPPRDVEARLLIGDKAMKQIPQVAPADLGHEWTSWTNLPFVFAAWISRISDVNDAAVDEIKAARDKGCQNIASVIPQNLPLPFETVKKYLENLVYHLGEKEREGLLLFHDYLLRADLVPQNKPLQYAVS